MRWTLAFLILTACSESNAQDRVRPLGNAGGIEQYDAGARGPDGSDAPDVAAFGMWSAGFMSDPNACHERNESLETYCAGSHQCVPLNQWTCRLTDGLVNEKIEQGCGYLRFSYTGDVGDAWGRTYDVASGGVLYVWTNGRLSSGCSDAIYAGREPACNEWTAVRCQQLADAGVMGW